MEEKILIKATFSKMTFIFVIFGILIAACLISGINMASSFAELMLPWLFFTAILLAAAIIVRVILNKRQLIVTNKRVIARGAFGYRRDITLNQVSSLTTFFYNGIAVGSSSGKIKFSFCKNKMEVFDTISKEILSKISTGDNI